MISVIIPVYNTEVFIDKCLNSIQNQTYTDWECILVNDCSTDTTVEHIKKFLVDIRFRLVQMDKNRGPGACRNVGIDLAEGDWLTFIDADDFIDEDYFETMMKFATKENDMIEAGYYRVNASGSVKHKQRDINPGVYIKDEPKQMTFVWDKFYRSSIIKEFDIRFPNIFLVEDAIFNLVFWAFCRRAEVIDKRMYYHRIYNTSLSGARNTQVLLDAKNAHIDAIEWLRRRKKKLIHDQRRRLQRRIEKYYSEI